MRETIKSKRSVEKLHHMSCSRCKKWWTIGDAPRSKKKWFCPWCGTENAYGKKKPVIVAVSGGFDPVHIGHIRMFREAKRLGDKLIVILNNDNWLKKKKGFAFMPQKERKEIIEALGEVDRVILTSHPPNPKDMSVSAELKELKPDIFVNGGDRTRKNIPEVALCKKMGTKMIFNIGRGGKIQSSSWLLNSFVIGVMKQRIGDGVGVMILKNGKILLGKRNGDPRKADSELHGGGTWTMPGGKLEFHERFKDGAYRETLEETGIKIDKNKLKLISISSDMTKDSHFVTVGLLATDFKGRVRAKEPDEITEWRWFSLSKLPQPIFFPSKKVLANYAKGEILDE